MSRGHPIILYFSETDTARFPLILVIGREPNTDQAVENIIGQYDFRAYPYCGFWNTSYGMLARVVGISTWHLKQTCLEQRGSPIIYADSLPRGLLNHITDKHTYRGQITEKEIDAHITNIFSHRRLIDRIQLVVMSGLHDSAFDSTRQTIIRRCELEAIPVIHLPFFYGTNTKKIQQGLTEESRNMLKSIFTQFLRP